MTRIVLVRHGESHWNAQRRYQGQQDSGLTTRGRDQAERVSSHLVSTIGIATAVWSSDLPRAHDTARPYARRIGRPVQTDPRLREVDIGDWAGRAIADIAADHPRDVAAFATGTDVRRGGGETFGEMRARVVECLNDIAATADDEPGGETVVVFSHGGAIRVAAAHAARAPAPGHMEFHAPTNCSVTDLEFSGARTALVSYNLPLQE